MKVRAALHRLHRSGMVSQNKHRHVIRRLIAPPALPAVIRPGAAYRAKHIAPQNPGTHILEATCGHLVIDACLTTLAAAMHLLKNLGREEPFHQCRAAHAQRVLQILTRASGIAIQRDTETQDFDCHDTRPFRAMKTAHHTLIQMGRKWWPRIVMAMMLRCVTALSVSLRYKATMQFV